MSVLKTQIFILQTAELGLGLKPGSWGRHPTKRERPGQYGYGRDNSQFTAGARAAAAVWGAQSDCGALGVPFPAVVYLSGNSGNFDFVAAQDYASAGCIDAAGCGERRAKSFTG